ncbi:MAG TPA: hypothetical protein DCZ94_12350 [Lentisphaeria bacterium]|nr:MAG: hypothetical protein A2X48_21795 [Lentisphaerae bacterium GWF2_49_21]HBC87740.1 hypothetical protein [Lentisphaeria bacterium]
MIRKNHVNPAPLPGDDSKFRKIFEEAGDAIFIHDTKGKKILAANKTACRQLGYDQDELISLNPYMVDNSDQRINMPERIDKVLKDGQATFETMHQRKDGTSFPVDVTAQLIVWEGQSAIMSTCRDITRRKRAENTLLTAVLEWQTTFDAVKDVMFLLGPDFKILRCNKAASEMFKKHSGKMLGKFCWEVVHGTTEPLPECPTVRMQKTKKREVSVVKSGDLWLEITVDPILDEEGGICGIVHIVSDITERRNMEDSLQISEDRFRNIFDSMGSCVAVYEAAKNGEDFIIKDFNKSAEKTEKISRGKVIGRSVLEVFPGVKEFGLFDVFKRVWKTGKPENHPVSLYKDKRISGWKENYIYKLPSGEIVAIYDDTTERKQVEQELEESYERFKLILEGATDGILIADIHTKKIKYSNPGICKMLGYSAAEFAKMSIQKIHPAPDWPRVLSEFESQARGEKTIAPNIPCLCKDGKIIYVDISAARLTLEGTECNVGFFRDITERKQFEYMLLESKALYQDILANQSAGIYRIRVRKKGKWSSADKPPYAYEFMNDRYCELTGARREEHLKDPTLTMKMIHPDDWDEWVAKNEYSDKNLKPFFWEGRFIVKGNVRWMHYESRPRELPDGERIWTGVLLDITERKMVEEGLNQSLSLLSATVESTTDGILVVDLEGKITYSNSRFSKMWNIPREIIARGEDERALNYVLDQLKDPDKFISKVKYLYVHPEEGSFDEFEFKDGRIFERYSHPQRINGKPVGRVWSFRDVTESRKASASLISSERKYKSLIDTTNTGYVTIDDKGRVIDANQEYVHLTGHKGLKDILGRQVTEWTAEHERKRNAEAVGKCAKDGYIRNFEIDYVDSSGKITPIEINATVIETGDGPRILTLCRDITERRKSQEELRKNEALIRNISNNLASGMIYQLLRLKDRSRRFTYLSETVQKFYGITPEEGMKDASLIYNKVHPEDRERIFLEEEEANEKLSIFKSEARIITPSGGIRWSFFVSSPRRLEDGTTCWDGIEFDMTDRKLAEAELARHRDHLEELVEERSSELKESEKKYRELVENTNSIILRMDNTGKVTFFNEFAQMFFGFSNEEILGKNVVGTIVPKFDTNGADLKVMILDIGRHPEKYRNNLNENMRKNGERVWIAWTNKPILDKKGNVIEILCVGNDISDRVNAERELDKYRNRLEELVEERTEELMKSESRFQKIVEQSPMSMAIVGMDGTIEFINNKSVETFGYSHEDIPNMDRWWERAYPDEKYRKEAMAMWMGLMEKAIADNHEIEGREYHVTCKNGDVKIMFIFGVPVASKVFVMFDDITERRRTEQALETSEERFRTLFENSKDALMTLSPPSWKFTSANPAIAEMFGVKDIEEFIRHAPWELSPLSQPDGRQSIEKAKEMIEIAVRDGYNYFEWTHRRLTGEEFPATVLLSRVKIKDEIILQATVRDISTQRKAEEERLKLEERLRHSEKMEAIGQLAGGIAHDFNNQLMGIMGCAELLYDRLDDVNLRNDIESILRASRRASDLTKDLLAFSRKGKFLTIPVNVHKVIEEVISVLEHSIDKRIEIKRILKASPAIIVGDPTQLQNALLNMAINARDAMPNGGEITFTTENVPMEEVFHKEDQKKALMSRYLKICISDTGIGIDKETIKHIFEPFFTTKGPDKGTGMGLASVYGTVNSHNGIINVNSEPGKGSVFCMYFPLMEDIVHKDDSKPESTLKRKGIRILLVDDEEIVRNMVGSMLRSFGHKVMTCNDGLEAVEFYRNSWKDIDLVVLDIMMPRMNGKEAFVSMKSINSEIRVLLASGYSMDGETQGLLDAGAKAFIQKPFNMKELSLSIEDAMKEHCEK